jgi:lipoprotein-releasing system permease protein
LYRTFLSLRYLKTRPTNWIGVVGIFVAVTALILILSIMSGFLADSRSHMRGSLADLLIQPFFDYPEKDRETNELYYLPNRPDKMLEVIRADPRVEAACAQLQWYGILNHDRASSLQNDPVFGKFALVSLVGIDFEDEYETTELYAALTADRRLSVERVADPSNPFAAPPNYEPPGGGRPKPSVLLGAQLAYNWGLHAGDELEIVTSSVKADGTLGEPTNSRYVVAGTFRSTHNETDGQRVYMDRRELADLLTGVRDTSPDYSHVLVKLKDYKGTKVAVQEDLAAALADAHCLHHDGSIAFSEIRTWEDFRQIMLKAIDNEKSLMGIMLSLVLVVAGFTVFAILSMMVSEKRRDIGIISALGGTRMGILMLFLLIGFWEALVGATLGGIAGVWAAINIDPIERWLSSTFGWEIFDRSVYFFDHIPSVIEVTGIAKIVLGAFFCALLFAAIPAWRAARLNPIDALRYE